MNLINNRLKNLFIPLGILSLVFIFLFNDQVSPILMANFSVDVLNIVYYGLFHVLFFVIFFIYILIPFLKILFKSYGSIIQRILLTLSIISFWITYLLPGFGAVSVLFVLFLAVFLNFTSKIYELTFSSCVIVSTSSVNILLMVYISIFLLLFDYYFYPYWISIILSFLFVISSIFYSEKVL